MCAYTDQYAWRGFVGAPSADGSGSAGPALAAGSGGACTGYSAMTTSWLHAPLAQTIDARASARAAARAIAVRHIPQDRVIRRFYTRGRRFASRSTTAAHRRCYEPSHGRLGADDEGDTQAARTGAARCAPRTW